MVRTRRLKFPRLIGYSTGFDLELTKGINNDQIIMAMLQSTYLGCNTAIIIWSFSMPFVRSKSKQLFIVFSIYRFTKNKQCKSRLRRKLTQTLIVPKFSYAICLCIYSHGFVKKKYHKKCTENTLSIPKAIRQTRLNHWAKDE